jgi:hypothetical protein
MKGVCEKEAVVPSAYAGPRHADETRTARSADRFAGAAYDAAVYDRVLLRDTVAARDLLRRGPLAGRGSIYSACYTRTPCGGLG